MNREELIRLSEDVLSAWNLQDVEKTVACYSPDLQYRDPNTKGMVNGADAMRRYLVKLFGAWEMHWSLREVFPFTEVEGGAFLWRATLKKPGTAKVAEVDGMDLVILEGTRIKRNEVYFDRAALASIL
jgi:ketosteroid isomerase-like protein